MLLIAFEDHFTSNRLGRCQAVVYNQPMVPRRVAILAVFCAFRALAQTPTVGSGAPSAAISTDFQEAYNRGNFSKLVGAPLANVASFGSGGLIQLFPGSSSS